VQSIGDQVAETVRIHTAPQRAEAALRAADTLARVGLPPDRFPLSRYPHELSGGQRQRVAIAMAIALRPKLLIADEPTTALDVTTQAQILDLLKRLVREDGMGLMLITHDLAVAAGLADRLQGGAIRLHGEAVSAEGPSRALRRRVQAVFQDPYGSFNPRWRVEALVSEPFHLLDDPPRGRERRERVEAALADVGLSPADADKYPHEFSGGQRQRLAIARALVIEPELIVLDEATSALDVSIRARILDLLADLATRRGLAYLFIAHDLALVRAVADRVYVMQAGRIVEHGPAERLFTSPAEAYTQSLLAASPDLDAALARRAAAE
jgi:peptide/nickel transport system ATP-binding protein